MSPSKFQSAKLSSGLELNDIKLRSEPGLRGELLASGAEKIPRRALLSSGLEQSDKTKDDKK
jgi:hypothetical protein